jgi:hypothetical protein
MRDLILIHAAAAVAAAELCWRTFFESSDKVLQITPPQPSSNAVRMTLSGSAAQAAIFRPSTDGHAGQGARKPGGVHSSTK